MYAKLSNGFILLQTKPKKKNIWHASNITK